MTPSCVWCDDLPMFEGQAPSRRSAARTNLQVEDVDGTAWKAEQGRRAAEKAPTAYLGDLGMSVVVDPSRHVWPAAKRAQGSPTAENAEERGKTRFSAPAR